MTLSRRDVLAGGLAAPLVSGCEARGPREWVFATTVPPFVPIANRFFAPWTRGVEVAWGGDDRIRVVHGAARGTSRTIYDALLHGAADLAYIGLGALPGWWRRVTVVDLPFVVEDGVAASAALWSLFSEGLFAGELSEVHPIAFHAFPPLALHTRRPVERLSDLSGLRIASVFQAGQHTLAALGASPLSISLPDTYVALAQGFADGVVTGWGAVLPFKLAEVAPFHAEVPLGSAGGMIVASRRAWTAMPTGLQVALREHGGLPGSLGLGRAWSAAADAGRAYAKAQGQAIWTPAPRERRLWEARAKPVVDRWVKVTPDGPRLLERFQSAQGAAQGGAIA